MELLLGCTLSDEIRARKGAPDLPTIRELALGLTRAVAVAHREGIVHRDIKPENVFLARRDGGRTDVVLLDFGLMKESEARRSSHDLTRTGAVVGTSLYMAPEQVRGEPADARTDVYSLGVILFELLTSRAPFLGDTSTVERAHVALRPPRPSLFAPVPAGVEGIVLSCLAKDPSKRPEDGDELLSLLSEASWVIEPDAEPPGPRAAQILAGGTQPVVIASIETRAPMPSVVEVIARFRGVVVRQRRSRYVVVFTAKDAGRPASAASAAAREIVERLGGRAMVDLANVAVHWASGRMIASGADLDRALARTSDEPWSGVMVSENVAKILMDAADHGGVSAPDAALEARAPLIGRDDVTKAFEKSAGAALRDGSPWLVSIVGDAGSGKSRLASEAERIARAHGARQIMVCRSERRAEGSMQELADVLRVALDQPLSVDDVEALTQERRNLTHTLAEGLIRRARETSIALIVDDAHEVDDVLIDALELATLEGEGVALWVVVTALPRFLELRPQWGARTSFAHRATLNPLAQDDAAALAAELLKPAEYPTASLLHKLARWSGGNAGCLVEIVRTLKRAGAQRRLGQGGAHLALDEIEALTTSPATRWLAARTLDGLPPDLASFARLCAVLGPSLDVREIEWTQDALDREGGAGTPIDGSFGLLALVERGILRRAKHGRYTFLSKVSRDAIVELIEPAQRVAIHRHALAFRRSRIEVEEDDPEHLEAMAAHARGCNERDDAVLAHMALADVAFVRHQYVEAELGYRAALAESPGLHQAVRAMLRRAQCLYRLHRAREAVVVLVGARGHAETLGEPALAIEILLEEATALDWAEDFAASSERVEQARRLLEHLEAPWLTQRYLVAEARSWMRAGRMAEVVEPLERTMQSEGVDYDTAILARVLLAVALTFLGRLDDAEERFDEAIAFAQRAEDEPHVCQLLINRVLLWGMRGDQARALEDMSAALPIARALGNPFLERQVTINVALLMHWDGRQSEAMALARRALMLDRKFLEPPHAEPMLLLARILVAMGEDAEAAFHLDEIPEEAYPALAPHQRLFFDALVRLLRERGIALRHAQRASWGEIVATAKGSLVDAELLELLYWCHRAAADAGHVEDAIAAHEVALPLLENQARWSRFGAQRSSWVS